MIVTLLLNSMPADSLVPVQSTSHAGGLLTGYVINYNRNINQK